MPALPILRRLLPIILVLLTGCSTHARPQSALPLPASALPLPTSATPVLAKGKTARIMALGDSITRGSGSGYGNYRRPLQSLLTHGGYTFQFVGASTELSSNYHGADPEQTFSPYQPKHEGYGGFRIEQISGDAPAVDDGGVSYPGLSRTLAADKPDVILIMLGTNDVNQAFDPGGPGYGGASGFAADAAGRLNTLIDRLYAAQPGLTIVLASITPLADSAKEANEKAYNVFVPEIVAAHRKTGRNIVFADMRAGLTAADLSPDGIHPTTLGYDKMARVWYAALTGQMAPPLPDAGKTPGGAGRLGQPNLFSSSDMVAVSSAFASLPGSRLVDGTAKAFVFGSGSSERVSISGFHGPLGRLRFFDTPSYTGRTPGQVTIYYSPTRQSSLTPGDYQKMGVFPLPVVGDAYESKTQPAAHPDAGDPASHPAATIGFCDLNGLPLPPGTQSLLLDFSKSGGDGDGLSEIQAFGPTGS